MLAASMACHTCRLDKTGPEMYNRGRKLRRGGLGAIRQDIAVSGGATKDGITPYRLFIFGAGT
jgi:hypothetical protein